MKRIISDVKITSNGKRDLAHGCELMVGPKLAACLAQPPIWLNQSTSRNNTSSAIAKPRSSKCTQMLRCKMTS